ncbi:PEP-CTERM sorting domain-containing protein [Pseudoduganella chitinolytica]|uniref:PEP-CTERM sorting domain-containing protein n=1 Tax=Pseudoduganella chitinolytica TaxID=34070 RepID=A0ABY8BJC9_9BURK|nr:PEP-CTERM sorting domain-containing protein [Pseudoduganella chitinolytica]WEF35068.1 PEP-CTERM sorting domain-containing protein [Pseudoduganella chitinolytica]
MVRKSLQALTACAVLATSAAAGAATNLALDGSFEAVPVPAGEYVIVGQVGEWLSDTHGIEVRNDNAGTAYEGNNFVELDTDRNSSMFQQIRTRPGQEYLVSFAFRDRDGVDPSSQGVQVLWAGYVIGTFNGAADWEMRQLTVHALTRYSELEFRAVGASDSLGTSLDAVSVIAVPEPQTYAMLLAGMVLLGVGLRRRQD